MAVSKRTDEKTTAKTAEHARRQRGCDCDELQLHVDIGPIQPSRRRTVADRGLSRGEQEISDQTPSGVQWPGPVRVRDESPAKRKFWAEFPEAEQFCLYGSKRLKNSTFMHFHRLL